MNTSDQTQISADLYSDGVKVATVKVPATDGFPDQGLLSFDGKIFALREEVSDAGGALPTIYDEVTPYAVTAA